MRAVVAVSLFVFLCPAIAMAQSPPAPAPASPAAGAAPNKSGDLARDAYIERAKRNAEKRFDRMDTDHNGVLSLAERRATRAKRRSSAPQ